MEVLESYTKEDTKVIKPPNDFKSGTEFSNLKLLWLQELTSGNTQLDLSDVIYMDTGTMRYIFDIMSSFSKITPPRSEHVVNRYNDWLDSKKGLSK